MALKIWDGFDHYDTTTDMGARSGFLQYAFSASSASYGFVTGRNGFGRAFDVVTQDTITFLRATFGQRVAAAFVGHAILFGNNAGVEFQFWDTVTPAVQVSVFFNATNFAIQIYRGSVATGTLLYSSANNVWSANNYQFIELFPTIAGGTSGSVQVSIKNTVVANVTGVNTKSTGNAWWDQVALVMHLAAGAASEVTIDDLYYADTTTGPGLTPCSSPLGDCAVKTLFAAGNDAVQWTPLTGANWQEISEIAMDSDVSYNYSSTPGQQDTFNFGALAGTITTIYGIQLTYAGRKDDAGARTVKSVAKVGGTSYFGAVSALPDSSYAYFTDAWILNPNTGLNWSVSDVNGASYGYNLVS